MAKYFKLTLAEIDKDTFLPNGGVEIYSAFTVIDKDDNLEYYLQGFDTFHMEPAKQAIVRGLKKFLTK